MKRLKLLGLGLFALGCILSTGHEVLAETPRVVGQVADIDGSTLMTSRFSEDGWFLAYPTMKTYFQERMKTGEDTSATIEFAVGGRAVVSPGTEVEVVGREARVLRLKQGALWAKFEKQETEFQIQTAGGVIGIEGTEFLVQVLPESEETDLLVVEGAVRVDNDAEQQLIRGGGEAHFGRRTLRLARFADRTDQQSDIRNKAFGRLTGRGALFLRRLVERRLLQRNRRDRHNRLFYSDAFRKLHTSYRSRRNLRPRRPLLQQVSDLRIQGDTPRFDWEPVRGAHHYGIVVSLDEEGEVPLWHGSTEEASLKYPSYGPELEAAGTYYVTVIPVNKDGDALERRGRSPARTSQFIARGHQPEYSKVTGVSERHRTFQWNALEDAVLYRITLQSQDGETVWVGESDSSTYVYPVRAREVDATSVTVEAYDSAGVLMGSGAGKVKSF